MTNETFWLGSTEFDFVIAKGGVLEFQRVMGTGMINLFLNIGLFNPLKPKLI
jgi:hypothetical protein